MTRSVLVISAGLVSYLVLPQSVSADPLFDYFGPLSEATFGGTGIPNDEVAVATQLSNGETVITVAMSATQRYSNPALTNDGAGTYFAKTGSNFGGAGESSNEGALWNFNYYISVSGPTEKLSDYNFTLFYDFDPALDNGPGDLGTINMNNAISLAGGDPSAMNLVEGSENLSFGFLTTEIPGVINPPAGTFDPSAQGEYSFGIQVTQGGWSVEAVRMDVQTVPLPAAAWLFGSALFGLVAVARRRAAV